MDTILARIAGRSWGSAAAGVLSLALAACAAPQRPAELAPLLHDSLFAAPAVTPDAREVFAMSPAMKAYADAELAGALRGLDPRRALIDALYVKDRLRLDYDGSLTRNAAEAFADRAGNCLSLVIMTASFARYLGLPVGFQAVLGDDFYSRGDQLTLASGHVNLVLDQISRSGFGREGREALTVDFLSQDDLRGQRTRALEEATVVAMYLNNRAAEFLVDGLLNEAYAFAREALRHDPGFVAVINTLGVIYSRGGHLAPAEAAFRQALVADPGYVSALSYLAHLLKRLGQTEEASALQARKQRLQPVAPFHLFNLGLQAMQARQFPEALELFRRELRLQPFQDEVHFWVAQAYLQLGQQDRATRHLQKAADFSRTRGAQARYAAKLEHLRHHRPL
jgi:tetratricopeptide (TPR) repeat protein